MMCVHTYMYMCCLYMHVLVYMHVLMYKYTRVCIPVSYTHTCLSVCIHVCIYVYTCICVCTHMGYDICVFI